MIESFRNELWPGYKTGEGIEPALLAQFPLLEEVLSAAGVVVWPMVEFEADDALASAARAAARDARVEQVVICTPDKDLAQCVQGTRIVQLNRRTRVLLDEASVTKKFGVAPESIPDYLAVVGDTADGYPGLPGWAPNRRPQSLPSILIWKPFQRIGENGVSTLQTRVLSHPHYSGNTTGPCCSGHLPPSGWTSRSSRM